jgi:hypothetical protein
MTYNYVKWTYFQEGRAGRGGCHELEFSSSGRRQLAGYCEQGHEPTLGYNGTTDVASNIGCFPGDSQVARNM